MNPIEDSEVGDIFWCMRYGFIRLIAFDREFDRVSVQTPLCNRTDIDLDELRRTYATFSGRRIVQRGAFTRKENYSPVVDR